jgi:hypothetical protein
VYESNVSSKEPMDAVANCGDTAAFLNHLRTTSRREIALQF